MERDEITYLWNNFIYIPLIPFIMTDEEKLRKLPHGFREEVVVTTLMGHRYDFSGRTFETTGALALALEAMLEDVRSFTPETPIDEVCCYNGTFSYTLKDGTLIE